MERVMGIEPTTFSLGSSDQPRQANKLRGRVAPVFHFGTSKRAKRKPWSGS
jgi:hypothetical protein